MIPSSFFSRTVLRPPLLTAAAAAAAAATSTKKKKNLLSRTLIIIINNNNNNNNNNNPVTASSSSSHFFLPSFSSSSSSKKTLTFSVPPPRPQQQQQQQRVAVAAAPKRRNSLLTTTQGRNYFLTTTTTTLTSIKQKTPLLLHSRSLMAGNLDTSNNSSLTPIRWPKAVLFGDSITQYGFSHDGCWVALIADFLQRKCDVLNRGFSGYNSRWCKKILPHILTPEDLKDAVFVTIFLGANDCADKDLNPRQHIPVDEFKSNMFDLVKEFEQMGMQADRVTLISPPVVDEETWAKECEMKGRQLSNFNKNTILYSKACVEVAKETGAQCVDLYTEMLKHDDWKEMLNDGLHLSNKGSRLLFSLLQPIVKKQTAHLPFKLPYWGDVDPDNLDSLLVD